MQGCGVLPACLRVTDDSCMDATTTQEAPFMSYRNQTAPPQTIEDGTRIELGDDINVTGGYNAGTRRRGEQGVVLSYATPTIQERQVWPEESYYVTLDGDNGVRVVSRSQLRVIA